MPSSPTLPPSPRRSAFDTEGAVAGMGLGPGSPPLERPAGASGKRDVTFPDNAPASMPSGVGPIGGARDSGRESPVVVIPPTEEGLRRVSLLDRDKRGAYIPALTEFLLGLPSEAERSAVVSDFALASLTQLLNFDDSAINVGQALTDLLAAVATGTVGHNRGSSAFPLFSPLIEAICGHVDPRVSSEGVEVLRSVIATNEDESVFVDYIAPLILSMAESAWPAPRSSAALLLRDLYECVSDPDEHAEIRQQYVRLCGDSSLLVRRAALTSLHRWADVLTPRDTTEFLLPLVDTFAQDRSHDSVRALLVTTAVELSRTLLQGAGLVGGGLEANPDAGRPASAKEAPAGSPPGSGGVGGSPAQNSAPLLQRKRSATLMNSSSASLSHSNDCDAPSYATMACEQLLPLIVRLSQDESWRVRYLVARNLGVIVSLYPPSALVSPVVMLTQDEEAAVRSVTAAQLGDVCAFLPPSDVAENFVAVCAQLAKDKSTEVRGSMAASVCQLCTACPASVGESDVIPVILALIDDGEETVKVSVVSHISRLNSQLESAAVAPKLCAALQDAALSRRWRVRHCVALQLQQLATYMGRPVFGALLLHCLALLTDPVAEVRSAMVATLALVSRYVGPVWVEQALVQLVGMLNGTAYSGRLTLAKCMESLLPMLSERELVAHPPHQQALKDTITSLAKDPVSNVRIAMAKALVNIRRSRCVVLNETRAAALASLQQDENLDVIATAAPQAAAAPF